MTAENQLKMAVYPGNLYFPRRAVAKTSGAFLFPRRCCLSTILLLPHKINLIVVNQQQTTVNEQLSPDADLTRLDALATLLDNRFRIPGTEIRFGLDGIIGLVPYVGDLAGFVVSGILMRIMIQRGAGPLLMLRMMSNFTFDAVMGIIPVAGDLFDFGYKANRRNVELLKKYYADGKAHPSAKGSLALLGLLFFVLFAFLIWGIWRVAALLVTWVWGLI